jgi:hypothetical protein
MMKMTVRRSRSIRYNSGSGNSHAIVYPRYPDLAKLLDSKKGEDAEEMLASMDGFGTFRPSTSFNDFSSLLSPPVEAAPVVVKAEPPIASVVSSSTIASTVAVNTKKRTAASPAAAPPSPKRKVQTARRGSASSKKEPVAPTSPATPAATATKKSTATVKPKPGEKTTPNPLTTTAAAAPSAAARAKTVGQIPKHITTIVTTAIAPVPTEVKSATVVLPKLEETEFNEMVAKASASTLIHSASGGTDVHVPSTTDGTGEKVDTSTAHIKALTGNNWVAACAGTTQGISSVSSDLDDSKNGCNRNRRQNLSPDERARQNRDRNREHARNTRLRKKAYVEELKRTLTELVSQRDAADFEKRQSAQRELEQREVRFRVIEEFLKLRGRNETNFARWAAILEDGFTLVLPLMNFWKVMQGGSEALHGNELVLNGVSDVMADANGFSEFLQTLGAGQGTVTCQFHCDRKYFFMDGCQAVLEWTATTAGAVGKVCFSMQHIVYAYVSLLPQLTYFFCFVGRECGTHAERYCSRQIQPGVQQVAVGEHNLRHWRGAHAVEEAVGFVWSAD